MVPRLIRGKVVSILRRDKSVLLLGPRQTGKSTLIKGLDFSLYLNLALTRERRRFEKDPDLIIGEIDSLTTKTKPTVVIDEIQKVPELLDTVQALIDEGRARFILTGSSARKLKRHSDINLLPGRIISLRMDPLSLKELPFTPDLDDLLYFGSLPGVSLEPSPTLCTELLSTYVDTYLEEEVRAEGLVRSLPSFSRFLELAAIESGRIVSFNSISQDLGVAHTTVASYYDILVDCLIAERIEPIFKSNSRKKLIRSHRYLFFDLGVRRIAANEGLGVTPERKGELFEHFVGLEILRFIRNDYPLTQLSFWRDPDGPEVDWVVRHESDKLIPFEVKLKSNPKFKDAKHLITFQNEYHCPRGGFIVCTAPRRMKISPTVTAIPWQELPALLKSVLVP